MTSTATVVDEQGERAPRQYHVPGEVGLWILLFGDMAVFAVLFAVYLQRRGQQPALFASSQDTLNRNLGALNTLLLLASSLLVVLATRAVRGASRARAPRLVAGAFAFGVGFIVVKAFEYHEKFTAGLTPSTNKFYMYYFVLTGLHLGHLVVGLVVLIVLWTLSRKTELSKTQLMFFEGGACFWHMVDLLWIVIFPLIFLVR
jgi:nitric oxide reductase NorE protein